MQLNFDNIISNADELLSKISEKQIYEYYLGHNIAEGKLYNCPFHKDHSPSLGFKLMESDMLLHRCFGCGEKGNSINFVSKLLKLSYRDTIKRIVTDLIAGRQISRPVIKSEGFTSNSSRNIFTVKKNFNIIDYNYWKDYHISLELLTQHDISSCKQVFVKRNNSIELFAEYSNKNPIYCYQIDDACKVYRPLNPSKQGKWLSSARAEDIQGMKQLPPRGNLLIITSSMKDLLVLKLFGYNAIALGGEGMKIPEKISDYLYACFDKILIFYDNDDAGINYAKKLSNEIKADYIYIPLEYEDTKDISDYLKKYSWDETEMLLNSLI